MVVEANSDNQQSDITKRLFRIWIEGVSSNMKKQTINPNTLPNWQEPTKIWNGLFFTVFFANMAFGLGQMMSNALLSIYADHLGAPAISNRYFNGYVCLDSSDI